MLSSDSSKPIIKNFPVKHADTQLTSLLDLQQMNARAEVGMTWRESRLSTAFMSDLVDSLRHFSTLTFFLKRADAAM